MRGLQDTRTGKKTTPGKRPGAAPSARRNPAPPEAPQRKAWAFLAPKRFLYSCTTSLDGSNVLIQPCGVAQGNTTATGRAQLRCGKYGGISAPPSCSSASCPLPGWCVVTWDVSIRNPPEGLPCKLRLACVRQASTYKGGGDGACDAQCREITNNIAPEPFRWTAEALLALQEVRWAAGPCCWLAQRHRCWPSGCRANF